MCNDIFLSPLTSLPAEIKSFQQSLKKANKQTANVSSKFNELLKNSHLLKSIVFSP